MNDNLKENRIHGDFNLPFTTYDIKIFDKFPLITMHWHEEIEIVFIEDGQLNISVDLNEFIASSGDIIFVKPFNLHSFKKVQDKESTLKSMVFNLSMLQSALTDGCLIKYIAPIINNENELPILIKNTDKGYEDIKNTLINLFTCYNEKYEGYELEIKSLLYNLFSLLYRYNLIKKTTKKVNLSYDASYKIKNVLNYISENYTNPITIKELAEISNFSEYHFMKFFKKYIGLTAIEYINNYRLVMASKLLIETDKSIMDISLEIGFNSVSYFNKLFKNTYNVTPKEFRKNLAINNL